LSVVAGCFQNDIENLIFIFKISMMPFVQRAGYSAILRRMLRLFPCVTVLGPRQCGKSTLVRDSLAATAGRRAFHLFDLERPSDAARLAANPEEDLDLLQRRPGIICIDEVQRMPALLTLLRVLIDDRRRRARYVLLGSASFDLVKGVSESLAGRTGFLDLTPFLAAEVGADSAPKREVLWSRGGFPPSYLARHEADSYRWRENYIRTFLERDLPALGLSLPAATLHRFWTMLAHVHGGLLNASELAAGLSVSSPTIARYLDILEGTFMIRRLPPRWENIGKRLVKAPKVYLRDSGLLHALLGIAPGTDLRSHPKVGPSFEGWVIEQVLGALALAGESPRPYFWRTHSGAEVDLLIELRGRVLPIEIKMGGEPQVTRGFKECMMDLKSPRGFIIHGGAHAFPLSPSVRALPVSLLADPVSFRSALLRAPSRSK
jgi:uncharacterized protein